MERDEARDRIGRAAGAPSGRGRGPRFLDAAARLGARGPRRGMEAGQALAR
jgi:hypothetical protein